MRYLRIYQSDKGIWHYEIERNGKITWSSLRTRDEGEARRKFARMVESLKLAQKNAAP